MKPEEEKKIAKEIVDELMKRIYYEIGKSVLKKLFWIVVALSAVAGVSTGIIHLPK